MELLLPLQILAGMLVLMAGNGLVIAAVVQLARIRKQKDFMVVFVIAGFATSLPELIIGLTSINYNAPAIALGNAIGVAIASMSFVAGMIAVFSRKLEMKSFFSAQDLTHLSLTAVLLIILMSDGELSRIDGILLLITFGYYLWTLVDLRHQYSSATPAEKPERPLMHIVIGILGTISMLLAAQYVMVNAVNLQQLSRLPGTLLGISILAPLCVIPELIFEIELIRRNKSKLTFGDLFTSVVVNTSLVIGLMAVIRPFTVKIDTSTTLSSLMLVVILLIFNRFVRSDEALDWREGLILVVAYLFFIFASFVVQFQL